MKKLYQDKRGVELKMAFYAVIAISLITIASVNILLEWSNFYDFEIVESDLNSYDNLNNISNTVTEQRGRISPDDPDPGVDAEATTFRSVFGILTNIFKPFQIVFGKNGMLNQVSEQLGIPNYIIQGIISMMVLSLIFSLVYIIFRLGRS